MLRLCVFLVVFLPSTVFGLMPDEIISDPVLEKRARALSQKIRCPVCQSETIDESNAKVARDLRLLLRERLIAGDTDAEILDFMAKQYGEFILFAPRFSGINLLLWIAGPLLFFTVLGILCFVAWHKRNKCNNAAFASLSPEEEEALKLLETASFDNEQVK